ncbi:MAG: FAD-binding oxidoreductase [Deltaproteobacteria bacterium]|nr:MAG: FAD-binding oxidoreductase [Deltaproteobacteria bacterium]
MAERVVVIGAGITGSLVAWRLQRAGWQVTVLEARHVGAGSSSRTAAGIRQQFSTPETVVGMRFSVDFYKRFVELVGGETTPIHQNGYLFLAEGEEGAAQGRARVEMQRRCGLEDVVWLAPSETVERFPWVDGDRISGASFCPSDGFLRPEVVYNEAIAAARRAGAVVLQNAPVVDARRAGARLVAVQAGGRWHEASLFIDATNAWSPRVAAILGAADLPVAAYKRHLWFIARGGSMSARALLAMPLVIVPGGAYCRPENAGSLMAGYAHDARDDRDFDYEDQDAVEPACSHRSGTDSIAFQAWMSLAEYLPPIGEFAGITATTAGYYGTTPDHNPYLGYDPVVSNLVRLVGFSGHGAMFGPFTALVAEALAASGRDLDHLAVLDREVSLRPFRPGRKPGNAEAMVI